MEFKNCIITLDELILITGSGGFIGKHVIASLLDYGFKNIRCLVRPSTNPNQIYNFLGIQSDDSRLEIFKGNLLSPEDCSKISRDVKVIYHLAAGRGEKSFPDAYANSVVTTRNLLEACLKHGAIKRFVNVSTFAVYTNQGKPKGRLLDEDCPIEQYPERRGSPYCFAKVKQEEILIDYAKKYDLPYVIVRPGVVYGPGNEQIHARIGINFWGIFLHLGGTNKIPLTYVDNCAEAIVLAGIVKDIDREIFNIIDDDLPSSSLFLHLYKKHVKRFPSIYIPKAISYILCYFWEKYSAWSQEQLPNVFNRKVWHATWKKTLYTNKKLKQRVGWKQRIPTREGLCRYFKSCREKEYNA